MAMTVSDIEKKYAAIMRAQNAPVSFGEYANGKTDGITRSANEQRLKALTDAGKALSGYGVLAESLGARGLSGSGFARYARSAVEAKKNNSLKEADRYEDDALGKLRDSYRGYLDDFGGKQESLRKSVINELVKRGEMNPESIYSYAASAGLGEEAGKNLYKDVYSATSYYIKDSILKEIQTGELSVEEATNKAKRLMLLPDDVNEITAAAENYHKKSDAVSDEYLSYLESLSDKSTDSFPFGLQMLYEKILEKEGKTK